MSRAVVDWDAMEEDWRVGAKPVLQLSKEYGVSRAAIIKHWEKAGIDRDLSGKIRAGSTVALPKQEADRSAKHGFIYVVYFDDSSGERFYKIGMASAFPARVSAHQISSPFTIFVACAYFVENMRQEEKALHSMFSKQMVRGEWFKLSDSDIDVIAMRSRLS